MTVTLGLIETLYALTTVVFIVTGLVMVAMATRAYVNTDNVAMILLSVGFTLAVGGAAATMISAFLTNFDGPRALLLVDSGLTTSGFVVVVYSLVTYE